jgi:hypothetical protein
MLAAWELWAGAVRMEKRCGKDTPEVVAERIGALTLVGDVDEIGTWTAISRATPKFTFTNTTV